MCHKGALELAIRINSNPQKFYLLGKNTILTSSAMKNLYQFTISRKFSGVLPDKSLCNNNNSYQKSSLCYFYYSTPKSRSYCSKGEHELPKIMEFPQVIWPSVFKSVRNWILSNFIIMRYFDSDFNLPDFVSASKQAVEIVSGVIARGDIDGLPGLVTPEVISQVHQSLQTFTLKQRQEFAIRADDIFFCFPYEVGVMFPNEDKNEGENQSRFVEITMCYHAMLGLRELRESGTEIPMNVGVQPEYRDKIFILNYRFIREFTKGIQDDWTINAINHFKPAVSL